jgi:hypothetical protein
LNKAILDTDIFSEIIKGVDLTVATHAKTYRRVQQLGYPLTLANWRA